MRSWNGVALPRSASTVSAQQTSAALASRIASSTARHPIAVMICVPLISARPSFSRSSSGRRRTAASACAPVTFLPSAANISPRPISGSAMWLSGARSPLAPTEPCEGITGAKPALNSASACCSSSRRTPEKPSARLWMRGAKASRLVATGSGSPTPVAWLSSRLVCSVASWSSAMRTPASFPKPVLMPYIVRPVATASSTTLRLARTRRTAAGASAALQPGRLNCTRVASGRFGSPSRIVGTRRT